MFIRIYLDFYIINMNTFICDYINNLKKAVTIDLVI